MKVYSKKYFVEKIEEFGDHNPIYEDVEGSICYPAYLKVGKRAWLLFDTGELFEPPHRVHTSVVKDVEYTRGNQIIVTTQNTRLVFTLINETKE